MHRGVVDDCIISGYCLPPQTIEGLLTCQVGDKTSARDDHIVRANAVLTKIERAHTAICNVGVCRVERGVVVDFIVHRTDRVVHRGRARHRTVVNAPRWDIDDGGEQGRPRYMGSNWKILLGLVAIDDGLLRESSGREYRKFKRPFPPPGSPLPPCRPPVGAVRTGPPRPVASR